MEKLGLGLRRGEQLSGVPSTTLQRIRDIAPADIDAGAAWKLNIKTVMQIEKHFGVPAKYWLGSEWN